MNDISIRLNDNLSIVAQLNDWSEDAPSEIVVCLQDNDGVAVQDICIVRPTMDNEHEVEVLVWGDSTQEDYTHQFMIDEYKED
jgi:hypothetical protein